MGSRLGSTLGFRKLGQSQAGRELPRRASHSSTAALGSPGSRYGCGCGLPSWSGDFPALAGRQLVKRSAGAHHAGPSIRPGCSRPPALRDLQPWSRWGPRGALSSWAADLLLPRPGCPACPRPQPPSLCERRARPWAYRQGEGESGTSSRWQLRRSPPAALGLVLLRLPFKAEAAGLD